MEMTLARLVLLLLLATTAWRLGSTEFTDLSEVISKGLCDMKCGQIQMNTSSDSCPVESKDAICDIAEKSREVESTIRIVHRNGQMLNSVSVSNVEMVRLEATEEYKKIRLINVKNITVETSHSNKKSTFKNLFIENSTISKVSFASLVELHLTNSRAQFINQTDSNINEIDIIDESVVEILHAKINNFKSTFRNSEIKYLQLYVDSMSNFSATNMDIKELEKLSCSSTNSMSVLSSTIRTIRPFSMTVSQGSLLVLDDVTIKEIAQNGVIIDGSISISNSKILTAFKDSIILRNKGELSFRNVSVNGVQLFYTVRAVGLDNVTVSALQLGLSDSSRNPAYYATISCLLAVIFFLTFAIIFIIINSRRKRATNDNAEDQKKSSEEMTQKAATNLYTKSQTNEGISPTVENPMATNSFPFNSVNPISKLSNVPNDSQPQTEHGNSVSRQPEHFPLKVDTSGEEEPDYDEVLNLQANEDETKVSFLHRQLKESLVKKNNSPLNNKTGNFANLSPVPIAQSDSKLNHTKVTALPLVETRNPLVPKNPMVSNKPGVGHSAPPPPSKPPTSGHYYVRGGGKPPPPPRSKTAMEAGPAFSVPVRVPTEDFPPPSENNIPLYEDTVEEPLYAGEDELG